MKKILLALLAAGALLPTAAKAHCPLCTAGAGALAVGAAYIGVSTYVVGIFIGAFALALALWIPRTVKKKYVRYQDQILVLFIYVGTIVPLLPLLQHYASFNVYWFGEYGSFFNRTYMVNRFLIGSCIGAGIMYAAPYVSGQVSRLRKKNFPYQGMAITFGLLLLISLFFQFGL